MKRVRNLLKDNQGLTKLQYVMIAVLVVILVSVGYYAYVGYTQSSYKVKADDTAETVYDLAEKFFRFKKSAGNLDTFNEWAVRYGGEISLENQKKIMEQMYTGTDFESFFARYEKRHGDEPVYYLLLKSKDAGEENREEHPMFSIFENYLVNENITDHTFLIEYNGVTGEVLSVFYTEKADFLTYEGDETEKENVLLRDKESLNEKWQGYCGAELED